MAKAEVILRSRMERDRAKNWIEKAPTGTRVQFLAQKRTLDQNSKFWAMLSDVASQLTWYGNKLTPDEWKFVFLDALNRETRTVPSIDGKGMVDIGRSSSNLSKNEFCDLLEIVSAFGAEHGVIFHDQQTEVA
jgi:NinB protein